MAYIRGFTGKKTGKQVSLLHYHNDTGTGEEIAWMNSFYLRWKWRKFYR